MNTPMLFSAFPSLLAQVEMDPLTAAVQSRGMVLATLLVLIVLSVLSWIVIGSRFWALHNLRKEIAIFRGSFSKYLDLAPAAEALGKRHVALPHVRLMAAVLKEMHQLETLGPLEEVDLEAIERSMRRASEPLVEELEAGLSLLGTTASAAPFIGLFGTVWGIMGAFGGLADSGTVLQTVAPHIAQALVATAVGLLAAIPAAMAYNGLGRMSRRLITDLDGFGLELLNLVRRQHLRKKAS
jgi:biopolymer transport protein TolQ